MKEKMTEWAVAAGVRAVRTFAQTAVAMVPAGVAITDVGWVVVLSTAATAALLSLLTSVAGLPEAADGESPLDMGGPDA